MQKKYASLFTRMTGLLVPLSVALLSFFMGLQLAQAQAIKIQRQGEYTFITGGVNDEEQTYGISA